MAATTGQPVGQPGARWALLLRPRWLAWHSFVIISAVGMMLLCDWQLHRAESGNELSWAYTFEWPLFAAFTVYFWIKSLRDELREHDAAVGADPRPGATAAAAVGPAAAVGSAAAVGPAAVSGAVAAAAVGSAAAGFVAAVPSSGEAPAAAAEPAAGLAEQAGTTGGGRLADSWDATSWDAASWAATGLQTSTDGAGKPVDVSRATPADGEAYVARLKAEVQRSGRRGRR